MPPRTQAKRKRQTRSKQNNENERKPKQKTTPSLTSRRTNNKGAKRTDGKTDSVRCTWAEIVNALRFRQQQSTQSIAENRVVETNEAKMYTRELAKYSHQHLHGTTIHTHIHKITQQSILSSDFPRRLEQGNKNPSWVNEYTVYGHRLLLLEIGISWPL